MRLRVLGCAGGSAPGMPLSCYLVDDVVAVDAGALTTGLTVAAQRQLREILLTHGHLDHVWTLPLLLANRFGPKALTCGIHGSAYTLETLKKHLFNDRIWPDFTGARIDDQPLVRFQAFEPGDKRTLESGHEVTAVALNHVVPCQAYLLRKDGRSLLLDDLKKLKRHVRVLVTHLKPGYGDGIRAALDFGGDRRVELLSPTQEITL